MRLKASRVNHRQADHRAVFLLPHVEIFVLLAEVSVI